MKKLAVLILNYNGEKFLKNCYDSLLNQTSKDFDIYLVDNNSMDDSRIFTQEKFPSVKVINTGDNLGYTGAYNYVVHSFESQNMNYSFYLLLNNDTVCDKRMIEKIVSVFGRDEKIGVVVPAVVDEKMTIEAVGGKLLFLVGTTVGYKNGMPYKRSTRLYRCFWASGSALTIKASLFKQLGFFNDYFIYFEDLDLSWRVNNAGYHVVATEETFVKHYQDGALTASNFKLYLSEKNRILSYWQNLPTAIFCLVLPFLLLFRAGLLPYQTKSFSNIVSKLRGILHGIFYIFRYKKGIYPLSSCLRAIRQMNLVDNVILPAKELL